MSDFGVYQSQWHGNEIIQRVRHLIMLARDNVVQVIGLSIGLVETGMPLVLTEWGGGIAKKRTRKCRPREDFDCLVRFEERAGKGVANGGELVEQKRSSFAENQPWRSKISP